jgi:hypothetical protein
MQRGALSILCCIVDLPNTLTPHITLMDGFIHQIRHFILSQG